MGVCALHGIDITSARDRIPATDYTSRYQAVERIGDARWKLLFDRLWRCSKSRTQEFEFDDSWHARVYGARATHGRLYDTVRLLRVRCDDVAHAYRCGTV